MRLVHIENVSRKFKNYNRKARREHKCRCDSSFFVSKHFKISYLITNAYVPEYLICDRFVTVSERHIINAQHLNIKTKYETKKRLYSDYFKYKLNLRTMRYPINAKYNSMD